MINIIRVVVDHYRDPATLRFFLDAATRTARATYRTLNHFGDLLRTTPTPEGTD